MIQAGLEPLVAVVAGILEGLGIGVVITGAVIAAVSLYRERKTGRTAYEHARATLGRGTLLGLELLVAADIVNTVAIDPTLESVAVLAGIVLVRTFLSLSLEVEIEGRWPWRRHAGTTASGGPDPT